MKATQRGFTLIEIAIVLVIIGLLLGGVLKGQELITSARVRNLISQQDGVKAAFFGFQDRFRAFPGDYTQATVNIVGATRNGNGNGRIEAGGDPSEDILVWEHLSRAGFINGSYTYAAAVSPDTNLYNPYSIPVQVVFDANFVDTLATIPQRHNIKSGSQIPVDIIAEVDRKIDDGNALRGGFRFSVYDGGTGNAPAAAQCHAADGLWLATSGETNCGGVSLL